MMPTGEKTSRGEIRVRKDAMNWKMGQHSETQQVRAMPRANPIRGHGAFHTTPQPGSGSSTCESVREEAGGSIRRRHPEQTLERTDSARVKRTQAGARAPHARAQSERAPRWLPKGLVPGGSGGGSLWARTSILGSERREANDSSNGDSRIEESHERCRGLGRIRGQVERGEKRQRRSNVRGAMKLELAAQRKASRAFSNASIGFGRFARLECVEGTRTPREVVAHVEGTARCMSSRFAPTAAGNALKGKVRE